MTPKSPVTLAFLALNGLLAACGAGSSSTPTTWPTSVRR